MTKNKKLAEALLSVVYVLLHNLDQKPTYVRKPSAGGLLIEECIRVGTKTLGITECAKLEVYCEETGNFKTFKYSEACLAVDEMRT